MEKSGFGELDGIRGVRTLGVAVAWGMNQDWRPVLIVALGAAFVLGGCSSETVDQRTIGETRWAPTTTAYDPECASGCQVLEEGEFGHVGAVSLSFNPDVDDPVAQWGDCIESFRVCVGGGGEVGSCSEDSVCPEDCKADFEARLGSASEIGGQLAAFKAVYLDEGAPCLPPVEEVSP